MLSGEWIFILKCLSASIIIEVVFLVDYVECFHVNKGLKKQKVYTSTNFLYWISVICLLQSIVIFWSN